MNTVVCALQIPTKRSGHLMTHVHKISKLLQEVLSCSLVSDVFQEIEVSMSNLKVLLIDQSLLKLQGSRRQSNWQTEGPPEFLGSDFVETHVRFQGNGLLC